jgi:plasmid maintenance system antidote protein VapI
MIDLRFLKVVRAAIAAKEVPKKSLARKCKVSRPQFSEMIHGDRPMPLEVQQRLIKELGIMEIWAKLSALANLDDSEG